MCIRSIPPRSTSNPFRVDAECRFLTSAGSPLQSRRRAPYQTFIQVEARTDEASFEARLGRLLLNLFRKVLEVAQTVGRGLVSAFFPRNVSAIRCEYSRSRV